VTSQAVLGYQAAAMVEAAKKPVAPRRPPPPPEGKPIFAGRLWIGVAMLLGFGLIANPKFNSCVMGMAPPEDLRTDFSKWKEGSEAEVRVTLITADSTRLSCASAKVADNAHCEFGADHNLWGRAASDPADDNHPNIIQPYRTSPDNALILLAGLWAQPDVAMRLHREPPAAVTVKRENRFDVTCRVKFLTRLDSVDLRWDTTGSWQTERQAWMARALSCTVNNS
jgi:hypothetical protein